MSRSRGLAFGAGVLVVGLATIDLGAQSVPPDPGAVQDAVWVAVGGPGEVLKLASEDGTALLELDAPHVRAVAAGTDRVWTAGASIRVFDFAGVQTLELALPSDAKDPDEHDDSEECEDERHDHGHPVISLDLRDGSAWISGGKSAFHFSSDGTLLRTITLPKRILGISFDPSHERVWIGTKKSLTAYDAGGALVADLPLPVQSRLRSFSSDPQTGDVWASIADDLFHYEGGTLARTAKRVKHVRQVAATTDGRVWAAAKERLFLFDGAFTQLSSAALDRKVIALATLPDVGDGSAWAATRHSLSRISTGGSVLYSVALGEVGTARGVSLSATRDRIPPTLLVESPPNDSFVADQTPTLVVRFSDVGSGVAADTLRFEISGQLLSVVCGPLPGGAACTPTLPLPEGLVELTATVEDVAHNLSAPAHAFFTVDVTPPTLVVDFPPAAPDLLTSELVIEIRGSVSEPVALTIDGASVPVDLSGAFSLLQSLQEGVNVFELVATDRAGLVAVMTRRVVRDTIPPPAVDPGLAFVGESGGANATLTIDPGGAEPGATLEVRVTRTNEVFTTVVRADGGAVLTFSAIPGEEFVVTIIDRAGNRSAPATFRVPTGVEEIPPDPATLAPPISGTTVTDIFTSNSFLFTGPNAIQRGVSSDAIEPARIAILRGQVLDRAGAGVPGVRVTATGADDLGSTLTRADGFFDFCANGGGEVVLSFQKSGFVEVQRRLVTSWRRWTPVEPVVLTALDAAVSVIDLAGSSGAQIARGSQVLDEDGARRLTMIFPAGTTGALRFSDGRREVLPAASLRLTELTVGPQGPSAMSAVLPDSSQYTFAFEASADESRGAVSLELSQVVPAYVENFLGFPRGTAIPAATYDRQAGIWVPQENGLVLDVVSVAGGMASLSVDPTGLPASDAALESLGITLEERIAVAEIYTEGQSLMRVGSRHFSSTDWNFQVFSDRLMDFAPLPIEDDPVQVKDIDDSCLFLRSVIECENQNLREVAPVVGSGVSLNYQSARTKGRAGVDVGISSKLVSFDPEAMSAMTVSFEVEGQREVRRFTPQTGLRTTFVWGGKDAFGREVQGERPATIEITYEGNLLQYWTPDPRGGNAFGWYVPVQTTGVRMRTAGTVKKVQRFSTTVGSFDELAAGLAGFSLSNHHVYSPDQGKMLLGNGEAQAAQDVDRVMQTVAGNGLLPVDPTVCGADVCDGARGTSVQLNANEIAPAPDGSVFYRSPGFGVRRLRADGMVERWTADAGLAPPLESGCAPGRDVSFGDAGGSLFDTAFGPVGPEGGLYLSALGRIARLDLASGILCIIAGTGSTVFSGDGGPALSAGILATSIAVAQDGSVWFHDIRSVGDTFHSRLRRIAPDGTIRTVAGGASVGNLGDGGLASQAQLGLPLKLLGFGPDGSLYFSDNGNQFNLVPFPNGAFIRIRRIDPFGRITRFAGDGRNNRSPDGSLASTVPVHALDGGIAPDGSIVFVDAGALPRQIRRIGVNGRLSTIAGAASGGSAFTAEETPARSIRFSGLGSLGDLQNVKVAPDGTVYYLEARRWIRRLVPSFPGFTQGNIHVSSRGGGELYRFDASGRHLETRDALTNAVHTSFGYDAEGRLTSMTDADGNALAIERGSGGAPIAVVAPGGQRTTFTLDPAGRATAIANPAGETSRFDWSADGLLRTFTNPRGHRSDFSYGTLGALTLDRDAAGGFQALARTGERPNFSVSRTTALGRQTRYRVEDLPTRDQRRTVTSPNGSSSTLVRQANEGRLRTLPDGTSVTVQRTPDPRFGLQSPITSSNRVATPGGRVSLTTKSRAVTLSNPLDPSSLQTLSETTSVNGRPYTSVFNRASLTSSFTTPAGRSSVVTLDAQRRVTRSQRGSLAPSFFSYAANGLLSQVVSGEGIDARRVLFEHDAANRLIAVTDPLGRTTRFSHDEAGRVIAQLFPDGGIARAAFDANSNVVSLSPPDRPAHQFAHSPVDLETAYRPPAIPDGGTNLTASTHDLDRAPTLQTRADGSTISPAYDAAGRLASLEHPGARLDYGYHPTTGRLSQISATGGGTLSFGFDGPLPTSETLTGPVSGSIQRTFDNDFRLSSETVNGAFAATFAYDLDGLLVRAGDLFLARDSANGLLTGSSLGGIEETRQHSVFGEPSRVAVAALGVPLFETLFDRDKLGRITRKTETIDGATTVTEYGYDIAGRLETVAVDGLLAAAYSWDRNGNRLSATTPGGTALASYDAQDRLLSLGDASFTYTAAGELATMTDLGGTTAYRYDPLGNVRRVDLPAGRVIEYVIDGRNRRVGKKIDGVLVQGFLYRDQLEPVAELDGAGNVVARFVYGSKAQVPDYMIKSGAMYRIVSDHLGSPRVVINTATGAIAQRIDFDEWGNVTLDTAPGFQPFGFAGGLLDLETGLTRFGARDYAAEFGRWTAKEPLGFAGSLNFYSYAENDPINRVDRNGLRSDFDIRDDNWDGAPWAPIEVGWPSDIHYSRNKMNPVLPYDQLGPSGWTQYPDEASIYHTNPPGCNNEKWGSPDGHGESVFSYTGDLVSDPSNMGTYNYWPGENLGHVAFDIVPYWLWGNTPDDPTPFWNRVTGPDPSECVCSAE